MTSAKYRTRLKRAQVQALHDLIQELITTIQPSDDEEKLLLATLSDVRLRLWQRLGMLQKEYSISFPPAQAIALRLLYTHYVQDATSYLGNCLHHIANAVHQRIA